MGRWTADSKAHVATMSRGDFASNEKSTTVRDATTVRIEFVDKSGAVKVLKDKIALKAGEVIDGTFMSSAALVKFLEEQIEDAKKQGVLFSVHLKATMMKVSDPIIFGFAVRTFFKDVFDKHARPSRRPASIPTTGWATSTRRSRSCRRPSRRKSRRTFRPATPSVRAWRW
jgi:isocitrate dehydrogenase